MFVTASAEPHTPAPDVDREAPRTANVVPVVASASPRTLVLAEDELVPYSPNVDPEDAALPPLNADMDSVAIDPQKCQGRNEPTHYSQARGTPRRGEDSVKYAGDSETGGDGETLWRIVHFDSVRER
jgi:hypothetical protein